MHLRADGVQALGVVLSLGVHGGQRGIGRARQRRHAPGLAQRVFVETGVGQHQRHTTLPAGGHEIGPDLGLHQDADGRAELAQKAQHGPLGVPRLPHLHVTRLQQLFPLGTAGGGAMGEQQAHAGQLGTQLGQQNGRCACLAQRHGMDPDELAQGSVLLCSTRLSMGCG